MRFIRIIMFSAAMLALAGAVPAGAADGREMKLTITPPLIKNNMSKGDHWASAIKLVNNSFYPIAVYTQVMDFKSREDGAGPEFFTKGSADNTEYSHYFLSQWLDVIAGPIMVPAQQSVDIPFAIQLPPTAEPGGHYAAILVGTQPKDKIKGTGIKTSSFLTSLVMINVQGETMEKGRILEFSSGKSLYQRPPADFTVRFANEGNVHLQPQGNIIIYNMFGQNKGQIEINHNSDFGNVLPKSSRKWNFNQDISGGFWSMGRYKAVLSLAYGNEAKEKSEQTLYFWIVNVKLVSLIGGGLILLIIIIVLLVKRSIKKAVLAAARSVQIQTETSAKNLPDGKDNLEKTAGADSSKQARKTVDLRKINK